MKHKSLVQEVRRVKVMAKQVNTNSDVMTRCVVFGHLGYLQGVLGQRRQNCSYEAGKARYSVILNELTTIQQQLTK
jgi:hypothetical protein